MRKTDANEHTEQCTAGQRLQNNFDLLYLSLLHIFIEPFDGLRRATRVTQFAPYERVHLRSLIAISR